MRKRKIRERREYERVLQGGGETGRPRNVKEIIDGKRRTCRDG